MRVIHYMYIQCFLCAKVLHVRDTVINLDFPRANRLENHSN